MRRMVGVKRLKEERTRQPEANLGVRLIDPSMRYYVCTSNRLIPLGVAGLITAMTVYISGNEEHVITLIFAPIVVFWAIGEESVNPNPTTTDAIMKPEPNPKAIDYSTSSSLACPRRRYPRKGCIFVDSKPQFPVKPIVEVVERVARGRGGKARVMCLPVV